MYWTKLGVEQKLEQMFNPKNKVIFFANVGKQAKLGRKPKYYLLMPKSIITFDQCSYMYVV